MRSMAVAYSVRHCRQTCHRAISDEAAGAVVGVGGVTDYDS
jgi:hypothetical protein